MKLYELTNGKRLSAPLIGYPGSKLNNTTAIENLKNAETQFDTMKQIISKWNPDIVLPFMDLSVEAEALGLTIEFHENESPDVKSHPVEALNSLNDFTIPNPKEDGRLSVFTNTIKSLKNDTNQMVGGYSVSPFTLAGLLMGAENLAINTITEQEFSHKTISFATDCILPYVKAQEEAGADFIVLLEPTAVLLSPELFEEFVNPYVDKIVEKLNIPVVLHVCGQTTSLVPSMCKTGVQALSLDSMVDFKEISCIVPKDIVLIGNVSPVEVMLNMSPEEVYAETIKLIESMEGIANFIVSTGCDLPPATPSENITSFMKAVSDYNSR